jgi:hypothetical protein
MSFLRLSAMQMSPRAQGNQNEQAVVGVDGKLLSIGSNTSLLRVSMFSHILHSSDSQITENGDATTEMVMELLAEAGDAEQINQIITGVVTE